MTVQCCQCKRILLKKAWTYPQQAIQDHVSHTYCPSCELETRLRFFSELASQVPQTKAAILARLLGWLGVSA